MKNLLTYLSPDEEFNDEHKQLAKIQIDNSLSLGWKPEDIMMVTNFKYKHNGVEAMVIENDYCDFLPPTTKIYAIVRLFKMGLIKKDEMYWYHDFDCYQFSPITEKELGLEQSDMGLSSYGRSERLCSASMFFKKEAEDIFVSLKELVIKDGIDEEGGLMRLINSKMDTLGKRVKLMNTTYAFHKFNILTCYPTTLKPIRAAHFHLTPDKYDFYVKGYNKLKMPLIPKRLVKIFNKHGFTK